MKNPKIEEKWIDTGRGKIFYYQNLSFANQPTVIFLHGLSSNHTTWLKIMKELQDNQYNSLALDIRGHGLSDKSKKKSFYKIAVLSEDLKKIIKKEKINKFIMVGYSFGGSIAIDYTIKNQDSLAGLVLISANHTNPLEYKHLKFLTPFFTGTLNLLAYLLIWQKRKNYHYYQHSRAVGYWNSVIDGLQTMPISVNFWLLANEFKINFKKEISQIKISTVIIYSHKDSFITKAEINDMAKAIFKSEIIISKNPNHFVGTNSQEEINQIILNFLKKTYENSNF